MSKVVGADALMRKFINISDDVAKKYLRQAVMQGTGIVQASARLLAPVGHSELRRSITRKHEDTDEGVIGTVYTSKEYAAYVEFGTGPRGQANHQGISPEVNPAYSQTGWLIPASAIDIKDAVKYKMYPNARITINGVDYYKTKGQPAQPFMYPALKDNEKAVTDRISRYLAKKIREEAKK